MLIKKQKAFTLIELMIVLAIIGVLAAIAIPQYNDFTSKTRAAATLSEIASIKSAVSVCAEEHGGILTSCNAGSEGIPNVRTTENVVNGAVVAGAITGTSGATTANGVALRFTLTPRIAAGSSVIIWVMDGTLCDSVRGLKPGQGGCPTL